MTTPMTRETLREMSKHLEKAEVALMMMAVDGDDFTLLADVESIRELIRLAERGMDAESVMNDLIDAGSLLAGAAGISGVRIDRIQPVIDAWFISLETYRKWKEKT